MAKPTNTLLDTARAMVTDAVCRVLDFLNEPGGSKIDLIALLPRLSVVQALLTAPIWESKLEITRSAYAITWTNPDFPALELSVWWPKTMVKELFVADEEDAKRLRPARFPYASPSMGIKWRGVKNASPRSREAQIRELTFTSVFPIVYPEEHKGEPYDRPASILARDMVLTMLTQRWLLLFAVSLPGKTPAQWEAKARAKAEYEQALRDGKLLRRLLLETNAGLAAWEKENNIAHPVPEETIEMLLDNRMKASKQAAEPGEDTAPVEDDSICLQLPDGQSISMTWVAWLRAEYITVNRANVVEGWQGLPVFEYAGGNWVGETSRTGHEFFITQLPKYKQPTKWRARDLLKLPGNLGLAKMEEAFEQQTDIKIHWMCVSDAEKAQDWYTQYRATFGKAVAPKQAAEPTAREDPAPDEDTVPTADPVHHPEHYRSNGIECIDAIRAVLTPEQFEGYCRGNAMKYLWRAGKKVKPGQTVEEAREEDLAKARWYLDTVIKQWETDREFARVADWCSSRCERDTGTAEKRRSRS